MSRLFGTDGIRGETGRAPLDPSTLEAIGCALGRLLSREVGRPARVVLGRDTRESGPAIQADVSRGLRRGGAVPRSAGVVPTPAVALLARSDDFDAGIVVSASHNAWQDNGVKVFSHAGTKLSDALEREIEALVPGEREASHARDTRPVPDDEPELAGRHAEWLKGIGRAAGIERGNLQAVVDCAHGAASPFAAAVLEAVGVRVRVLNASPDGHNINAGCGSLHLDGLVAAVKRDRADLGIAFDGDADRALFVDDAGRPVDGDQVLLIAADAMRARGSLRGGGIVGTIMSNHGLERALASRGLSLVREQVGDRFVFERMRADGFNLGGEPSGHVIFLDDAPTGDGLLTALRVLDAVVAAGAPLASLAAGLDRAPQVVRNVPVRARVPLESVDGYDELCGTWTRRLADSGRIVVRYSGTERLLRVMVEGSDAGLIERCADDLASHLSRSLNGAA